MLDPRTALLAVENLQSWYGESHILHGVNFEVFPGEVVTLLGRNGAGKTTTLKSIMGIVGHRTGSIRFENDEMIRRPSNHIARAGIAFCPEERGIFASLDVEENLMLPPVVKPEPCVVLVREIRLVAYGCVRFALSFIGPGPRAGET